MNESRARRRPRPRKRFGQHFLEPAWAAKVVRAIGVSPDDVLLEIGPGRGAITRPLAAAARHVVAVEIDRDLAAELSAAQLPRVTVEAGDILDLPPERLRALLQDAGVNDTRGVRVVGNLPYNVASPILFRLCAWHAEGLPILDATLMLQREVADRLTARAGTRDYGVLGILIRHVAAVDRRLELPPGAFRPPPKVRSTVVRLQFHPPDPAPRDLATFTTLVRSVFTRRRKTLANALQTLEGLLPSDAARALDAAGIDSTRRPETVEIHEFVRLSDAIAVVRGLPFPGER